MAILFAVLQCAWRAAEQHMPGVCPPASPPRPNSVEYQPNQSLLPQLKNSTLPRTHLQGSLQAQIILSNPLALAATSTSSSAHSEQTMARTHVRGRRSLLLLLAVLCAAFARVPAGALRTSAISAAPEYPLPRLPRHSALPPALSPDIMPVLPSPGADDAAAAAPPSSDVAPTIPSSPSPPNPDALEPNSALAPFGSAPAVAAQSPAPAPPRAPHVAWALPVGLVAMWLV